MKILRRCCFCSMSSMRAAYSCRAAFGRSGRGSRPRAATHRQPSWGRRARRGPFGVARLEPASLDEVHGGSSPWPLSSRPSGQTPGADTHGGLASVVSWPRHTVHAPVGETQATAEEGVTILLLQPGPQCLGSWGSHRTPPWLSRALEPRSLLEG